MALLTLTRKNKLGSIEVDATLREVMTDELQATEHPVEHGASIADHSYVRPSVVIIDCGWSNSNLKALVGAVTSLFSGGGVSRANYVNGIYSQLLKLQQSRELISVTTGLRNYDKMLITSLRVDRDEQTSEALMVSATCRQMLIVNTRSTTLPDQANQADPASTAEVVSMGGKQSAAATPAPGGTASPSDW